LRADATAELKASNESRLIDTTNKQVKRPRRSRALIKHERASEREAGEIKIEVDGHSHSVSILNSVLPTDGLYVQCDPKNLGLVIKYIRDEGLAEKECLPDQCRRHIQTGKILTWHFDEHHKKSLSWQTMFQQLLNGRVLCASLVMYMIMVMKMQRLQLVMSVQRLQVMMKMVAAHKLS